ncbi:MAG: ribbon-helix-helix protein, CopG family [Chloroflexota bacterium]
MTLRLTPEEAEALRETARRERRSMQEVAREAIAQGVTSRVRRRDEHLARIAASGCHRDVVREHGCERGPTRRSPSSQRG